jgi:hypothetical protein
MPTLNATTKIDEHKTVGEIQQLLASKGARSIMVDYDDSKPSAIMFQVTVADTPINFRLPCKFEGVRSAMLREITSRALRNKREKDLTFQNQSRRVAWRIIKVWVSALMALIEAGQAEIAEVFLPYISTDNQTTLYDRFIAQPNFLALSSGS